MMNFNKLSEKQYDSNSGRSVFDITHKFNLGCWKSIPEEMVGFGGMLLKDKVFKLPFYMCVFGGDHDFVENQFGHPNGMDAFFDDPNAGEFPWFFKRNENVGDDWFFTKSFAIEAIDVTAIDAERKVQRSCKERGSDMNADFVMNIHVDYGRDRGWENVGTMIVDQGAEFYWDPKSPVVPGTTREDKRLNELFSFAMGYFGLNAVLGAVASLASKSTKQEIIPAPEKLNRARAKKGKPPIYEYRKITIGHNSDMPKTINGKSIEGRASPRLHWRRGHYRNLSPDIRVPVAPALVGLAENGIIDKDYIIKHARESLCG